MQSGALALVVVGALSGAAACAADPQGSSTKGGATLTFGVDGTVPSLDPVLADNSTVDQSVVALYEALVDYNPEGILEGRLAESWSVSDDARSVTILLRDDATFHDGSPVTADDVKYTFDRAKSLGVGVSQFLTDYDRTEVVDDHELVIHLSRPSSLFLGGLAKVYVVNADLVEKHAGSDQGQAWLAANEAGSGPYVLKDFKPNRQVVFTRFDDYSGTVNEQGAQTIVYRLIPESSTQREELLAGNIDVADGIEPLDVPTVLQNDRYTAVELAKAQGLYVFFNTKRAPFDDPAVREGIRLVYDYATHVDEILKGHGAIATGMVPAVMDCRPEQEPFEQDLDRARQLLADVAASGRKLTLAYQNIFAEHADAATVLQSTLRDLGIEVKLVTVDYPTYIEDLGSVASTPDMAIVWDNPPTPDVGSLLTTRYHSAFVETSTNYGQYQNPAVDALLDEARGTGDETERCELYKKVQELLIDDSASMPVADEVTNVITPTSVSGVELHPAHVGYMPHTYKVGS